ELIRVGARADQGASLFNDGDAARGQYREQRVRRLLDSAFFTPAFDKGDLERGFHQYLQCLTDSLVLAGEFEKHLRVPQITVAARRLYARQSEHARSVGGKLEAPSQDVQHGQVGTEDQAAAGREAAVTPCDERQEAKPGLANVYQGRTADTSRLARGSPRNFIMALRCAI